MNLFLKNAHHITGYVNDFDAPVLYTCPNGGYLNGVSSFHDNKKEDRRYKFRCCTPRSGKYYTLHFVFQDQARIQYFCLLVTFDLIFLFISFDFLSAFI